MFKRKKPLPPACIHQNTRWRNAGIIAAVFSLHFLPFFFNGSNAYIRIHDNLEGEWVWLDLLVKQGKALDFSPHAMIDNVMNGQLRAAFPPGLSVNVLLIWLFGSYWGYLASYFIQRILAFAGMYLLLRRHFLTDDALRTLAIGVSLCFSLVPFYAEFGVAGHPLMLYCFLNILKDRERWTDFLFIVFFPFYSSLVWTGISVIAALVIMLAADSFRKKKVNLKFLFGIGLLTVAYCVVNFQMLTLSFLNGEFISHRTEYNLFAQENSDFWQGLSDTLYPLLLAHYHAGTTVSAPIIATSAIALYHFPAEKTIRWLAVSVVVICLAYGFYFQAASLLGDLFPFLITFKANRFIILLPLVFFIISAVSLKKIMEAGLSWKAVAVFLSCQLAIGFFSNDEWLHNVRNLLGFKIKPGFNEYFSENLFRKIDDFISQPKSSYRVAALAMSPSVLQYNGFYTLDGLLPIYSLEHKKAFRAIIAPELEKNQKVKTYFDAWGNRCYIFSSELGIADRNYIIGKKRHTVLNNFSINGDAFKKMGGRFIISAVEISKPENTGLKLLHVFENEEGWWRVYLYGIQEEN
ncbi:MAG TPA: DUF6044 family protein [Chitinophagales bacterium]|nr:DUF6044 family protein [Chitinophagales bacterium]